MSARRSLRERVEAARARNFKDFPVPALDLVVRCTALSSQQLQDALKRGDDVESAIDVLSSTCVGIYEVQDGKGVSPVDGFSGVVDLDNGVLSGTLPTFGSQALADALDVGNLADVGVGALVRAVVATKSDLAISNMGAALTEWSADINSETAVETRGN